MTLSILATIGLLVCAFYVYVLCQWMRDTKSKRPFQRRIHGQSGGTKEIKHPYIISSRKIEEKRHRSDETSRRTPRMTELSKGRGLGCNGSERIAYKKIVSSLSSRKRS